MIKTFKLLCLGMDKKKKLKKMVYGKAYSPSRYAKGKGVAPSWITQLNNKEKLKCVEIGGKYLPVHCKENDLLFDTVAHNANRKEVCPVVSVPCGMKMKLVNIQEHETIAMIIENSDQKAND